MIESHQLTVLYYGACPFCSREIGFYRRRRGAEAISWIDICDSPEDEVLLSLSDIEPGVCIHLLYSDGILVSGGEALVGIWAALPGFRRWGRVFEVITSTRSRDVGIRPVESLANVIAADDGGPPAATTDPLFQRIVRTRMRPPDKPGEPALPG